MLEKLEIEDAAVEVVEAVLPLAEDADVEEAEDDVELPLEPDSDSTAEKRSCVSFLIACRASGVESVDEVELSELEFALQFGV